MKSNYKTIVAINSIFAIGCGEKTYTYSQLPKEIAENLPAEEDFKILLEEQ